VGEADFVVHFAAQTSVPLSVKDPDVTSEINIKGTSNLLQSSVKAGIKKFVFISSCAVYGEPNYLPVNEKHPTNPISPYAQSKLTSENQCLSLNKQGLLKTTVMRFFNVYGPRPGLNDYSGVIIKYIDNIKRKAPLTVYGDGAQTRDFVYVEDAADSVLQTLENPNSDGEVFNIGTGKPTSIHELAEKMLSLTCSKSPIVHTPPREGDIKESYADINHVKNVLGYKPMFSLDDGLKRLLGENGLIR
jgi:UDP-glucose 4-epimerase